MLSEKARVRYDDWVCKFPDDKITYTLGFYEEHKTDDLYLALREMINAGIIEAEFDQSINSHGKTVEFITILKVNRL